MSTDDVEDLELVPEEEQAKPKKKRGPRQTRMAAMLPILFMGAIILMMLAPEIFTVLAIGLWPTFVITFVKPMAGFGSARIVLGFNFAGLMPALEIVWNGKRGMEDAWRVLMDG